MKPMSEPLSKLWLSYTDLLLMSKGKQFLECWAWSRSDRTVCQWRTLYRAI